MNIYIIITSWILFVNMCLNFILLPFWLGKERKPYGLRDWFLQFISAALLVPILGRILGWW